MKSKSLRKLNISVFSLVLTLLIAGQVFGGGAEIIILNLDEPGVGFNDPTPAAPVGGNEGATLGEQRLNALEYAASIWEAELDSNVPIEIGVSSFPGGPSSLLFWVPGPFSKDFSGVGNFPGAEFPDTWYPSALAKKRSGEDFPIPVIDLQIFLNSDNLDLYLGLDNNNGDADDLVTLSLHMMAHGLGFQTVGPFGMSDDPNVDCFSFDPNAPPCPVSIFDRYQYSDWFDRTWDQLSTTERDESSADYGQLAWSGPNVTAAVPNVLPFGSPELIFTFDPAPPPVPYTIDDGPVQFGNARFGTPFETLTTPISADLVIGEDDTAEPIPGNPSTTTDGCSPLLNAAEVAGKIVYVDRGACTFTLKAKNAQDAGAIGLIIGNNEFFGPPFRPSAGAGDPNAPLIVIPVVGVSFFSAMDIKNVTADISAEMGIFQAVRFGADPEGRARIAASPFGGAQQGHFDDGYIYPSLLLMSHYYEPESTHAVKSPGDLTLEALVDIGWFPDADLDGVADGDDCNPNSDPNPTVVIGGVDSGVENRFLSNGCNIADLVNAIAETADDHGDFVSGVTKMTNELVSTGFIRGKEKGAIVSAAAIAKIPVN